MKGISNGNLEGASGMQTEELKQWLKLKNRAQRTISREQQRGIFLGLGYLADAGQDHPPHVDQR
jgi:hypothetical protein